MAMNPRLLRPRASASLGFDPRRIANLAAWYDASDAASITLNGSNVSQWNDRSGLGRHLAQTTGANQPAYETNILNGRPVLTFNGTSHTMSANASAIGVLDVTFVFVAKSITGSTNATFVGVGGAGVNREARFFTRNSATTVRLAGWFNDANFSVSPDVGGSFRVWSVRLNQRNVVLGRDGQKTSVTLGNDPLPLTQNTLQVAGGFLQNFHNVSLAEILVYYSSIGNAATEQVEKYLGAKWGISVL